MPRHTMPNVHEFFSPNHSSRYGTKVDVILIHHTASNNAEGDLATLRNSETGNPVSAHYLIDRRGKVYRLVEEHKKAWHAGVCRLRGEPTDMNARSIGIELTNKGDGKTPFTEEQYQSLISLVGCLVEKYQVPRENLLGHREVAWPLGRKTDPADNFDWARLRAALGHKPTCPMCHQPECDGSRHGDLQT